MSREPQKKELSHLRLVRYGADKYAGSEKGQRRNDMAHEQVLPSTPDAVRVDARSGRSAKHQRVPQQRWIQTVAGCLSGSVVGVALGGAPGALVLGALGALAGRATTPTKDDE